MMQQSIKIPIWSIDIFAQNFKPLIPYYCKYNKYLNLNNFDWQIEKSYEIYYSAYNTYLPILLLGDAKIRTDEQLLFNFGTTTGKSSESYFSRRKPYSGVGKIRENFATQNTPKLIGDGSIFLTNYWDFMKNDAYILGGLHGQKEFSIALTPEQGDNFQQIVYRYGAIGDRRDKAGEKLWAQFFKENPELFWRIKGNKKFPSVLTREIFMLEGSKYNPYFDPTQLSFILDPSTKIQKPTDIISRLQNTGYEDNDRDKVLSNISSYLFKDPKFF
jgi:hypothetical protein